MPGAAQVQLQCPEAVGQTEPCQLCLLWVPVPLMENKAIMGSCHCSKHWFAIQRLEWFSASGFHPLSPSTHSHPTAPPRPPQAEPRSDLLLLLTPSAHRAPPAALGNPTTALRSQAASPHLLTWIPPWSSTEQALEGKGRSRAHRAGVAPRASSSGSSQIPMGFQHMGNIIPPCHAQHPARALPGQKRLILVIWTRSGATSA